MSDLVTVVIEGKSLAAVDADLRDAAARHRVAIFGCLDLRQALVEHGVAFGFPCRVYELSSPGLAAEAVSRNLSLAGVLPCRVCLYEWQGKTYLAMVKPTALLAHFDGGDLEPVLRQLERELGEVIDEAAA